MGRLSSVVASVLALSSAASAKAFGYLDHDSENLIPIYQDQENVAQADEPIIVAREEPNVLKPVRPKAGCDVRDGFNLRDKHTLNWGGKGGVIAELQICSAETERFLDTEYFDNLVESMECPAEAEESGEITIRFQDQAYSAAAASAGWEWVNEDTQNQLLLMIGPEKCGWNQDRIIYRIEDLEINKEDDTVVLHAKRTTWKKALHSYDFKLGKDTTKSEAAGLMARDDDSDLTIPLDADFGGKGFQFDMSGVTFIGYCSECSNSGSFDVDVEFSMDWFELEKASVSLSTSGITTKAIMQATLRGEISEEIGERKLPFFKVSPAGIAIPGIVTVGPNFALDAVVAVKAIRGAVTLTFGGTATLSPSTTTLDFLSEDGSGNEGWDVQIDPEPLKADTYVEAEVDVSLKSSIGLELSVVDNGYAAKISAELPGFWGILRAIKSPTCTACDKYRSAIKGMLLFGASATVELQKMIGGTAKDLWSLTLFAMKSDPLASFCEPVGPQDCSPSNSTFHRRAPDANRIGTWFA